MKEEPRKDAGKQPALFRFGSDYILAGTLRDLLDRLSWYRDALKVRFTLHDRTYVVQPNGWHIEYDGLEFVCDEGHEDEGGLTVSDLKKILNGELFTHEYIGNHRTERRVSDDMLIYIRIEYESDSEDTTPPFESYTVLDDGYEIDPDKGMLYLFIR